MLTVNHRQNRRIKWTYATQAVSDPPATERDFAARMSDDAGPPRPNDVIVAEVVEIDRHDQIESSGGVRAMLFPGDLVGVAYGHRYATRQWHGIVPGQLRDCHLLSIGGVCGEVVDKLEEMDDPTILRPLGYLGDPRLGRVNLRDFGLRPRVHPGPEPTVILVVGASMDSGKTTTAFSIVHGLHSAGTRVCAGKLTGTAASKDIRRMYDAGAHRVLDFTDVGHASTAECSREELAELMDTLCSQLSVGDPDFLVLEIADGLVQRETAMLLDIIRAQRSVDFVVYACCDSPGVAAGVDALRGRGFRVAAVSGMVACTPLAAREARPLTDVPVLETQQLWSPAVVDLFGGVRPAASVRGAVG